MMLPREKLGETTDVTFQSNITEIPGMYQYVTIR